MEMMFDLKVRDVMSTALLTATRDQPLRDIQKTMKANGITGVPIVSGRRLIGMVSMDDIIQALEEGCIDAPSEQRMSRNLIVLEDDMPVNFAITYMEKYRYGRFPVLNKDRVLVGIVTSRDVIVHLLINMNKELEKQEEMRRNNLAHAPQSPSIDSPHIQHSDTPTSQPQVITREWPVRKLDFEQAGKASTEIKTLLRQILPAGPPKLIRRIAIASYELEMNQVVHSEGGDIRFHFDGHMVCISARDRGPGIKDIESALTEGWSTATEWVRSLGFGAGMGLPNTKRVADGFEIRSDRSGTSVDVIFQIHPAQEG